jgi:hypothetical protein
MIIISAIYRLNIETMMDIHIFYINAYISLTSKIIDSNNYLFALSLLKKNTRLNIERFVLSISILPMSWCDGRLKIMGNKSASILHFDNLLINDGLEFFVQYLYMSQSRPEAADNLDYVSAMINLLNYDTEKEVIVERGKEIYYMRILWAIREVVDHLCLVAISEKHQYLDRGDYNFDQLVEKYKTSGMIINTRSVMIYGFSEPLWAYPHNDSMRVKGVLCIRKMLRKVALECFSRIIIPGTNRRINPHLSRILVNYF